MISKRASLILTIKNQKFTFPFRPATLPMARPNYVVIWRLIFMVWVVVAWRVRSILLVLALKCRAIFSHSTMHEIKTFRVVKAGFFLFIFYILKNNSTSVMGAKSLFQLVFSCVFFLFLGLTHEFVVRNNFVKFHAVVWL